MELRSEDIIITTYNIGSSWIPLNAGVRIFHIPTGLVTACGEHRSAHANKFQAYEELVAKLKEQSTNYKGTL